MDAEKITQAYITANEQRFKALRDLNMAIEDAKTLGLSTAEIVKPLKDAKTPNLNFLMAADSTHSFQAMKQFHLVCRAVRTSFPMRSIWLTCLESMLGSKVSCSDNLILNHNLLLKSPLHCPARLLWINLRLNLQNLHLCLIVELKH